MQLGDVPAAAPPAQTAAAAVPATQTPSQSASPVADVSPIERYRLEGRYQLVSRAGNRPSINNQDSGRPELVAAKVEWDSSHWEFEGVPGTALVWIKNSWKNTYMIDDGGRLRVTRSLADDPNGQWILEAVPNEPYVRIKSKGTGRYLVASSNEIYLDERTSGGSDSQWQFIPTAWPRPVAAPAKPRVEYRAVQKDDDEERRPKRRSQDRDDGYESEKARNSARASCAETGGYWTGKTCKAYKGSKPGKCKKGYVWSEDAGACQYDGGGPVAQPAKINRGNCGPGFYLKKGNCISQATGQAAPKAPKQPPAVQQQIKINQQLEKLNAIKNKCPKGQVWNKAEGCHEDD